MRKASLLNSGLSSSESIALIILLAKSIANLGRKAVGLWQAGISDMCLPWSANGVLGSERWCSGRVVGYPECDLESCWKWLSGEEELDQTARPIARSLQGRAGRQRTVLEPLEKCIHARKCGAETV